MKLQSELTGIQAHQEKQVLDSVAVRSNLTGTDSETPFAAAVYWAGLSSLIVLTVYRVLVSLAASQRVALVYAGIERSRVRVRR